ncbi:MAG: uroporphyrin-III C-methyltransferase [Gammaproteobacteria bacterium]|nr:MAG: uroporphyrin-III C-methyltransferase [Gammaproteobacteria bacterium]TND07271.1 MAG: uroporphyrin-III C-methyltransferase [Gammaproteobacteria bacterium]
MEFFPIFLRIREQPCLLIGGGDVAARKAALILRAGGRVTIIAPGLGPQCRALVEQDDAQHRNKPYSDDDLDGMRLVIAATDDRALNEKIAAACRKRNIPVNVVDNPDLCSFILPSMIDRSPVIIAVSTGGASPVLARLLRARLETLIPTAYGKLAELVGRYRAQVKQRFQRPQERRQFWERVLQGPIAEMVFAGRHEQAEAALEKSLAASERDTALGEVYLVGAGPGDPDLLTFRALRLMQQCDVVLYDRLVAPEILDLVRREAERLYVGKKAAYHSVRQQEINETLVRLAKQGKRVLRLKGGDPFIFGRGGEEIATLADEGIPFQVVPGITAASGCASYAGIPLTHRDYAQSVVFVTGHRKDDTVHLNWTELVQPQQTVVIYMGLLGLADICAGLIQHGMSPAMPAALIEQGTTPQQRVIVSTVKELPQRAAANEFHGPTLVIIGEVVRLHESLGWFGAG